MNLLEILKQMLEDTDNLLKIHVLEDLIEKQEEDSKYGAMGYIEDLLRHGCISGMVGHLVYYSDTELFYDKYKDEINELVAEMKDSFDFEVSQMNGFDETDPLCLGTINRNLLAWLGYEETARKIYDELEWLQEEDEE